LILVSGNRYVPKPGALSTKC